MIDQQLILRKMQRQADEMNALRFVQMQSLFPIIAMEDDAHADFVHIHAPEVVQGEAVEQNTPFNGRDRYLWLRKNVRIPQSKAGLEPVGFFDFGKTDGGHNSGFESLLYVNRQPYQGVDSNHKEVLFGGLAGQQAELTFMLWSGLEGGGPPQVQRHLLRRAEIGYLHQATDELYYLCQAIVQTLALLPQEHPDREDLIGAMEACLARIDWDEDCFHDTAAPALAVLKQRLEAMRKDGKVVVSCVGHTHIDVAWLWRLKHTREKALRSFSSVLHMMDDFDDYTFFQSQPQLYKYLKHDHPELYEKIKTRVAEGRWEPDGGMWLEADCNISSGEALSRQFLYGIRFFEQEFGKTASCLWLPDVFGYSWALPQIMKQCNIHTFMTTKIGWNQFNTIPNDLFQWRGIDGSQVLTYFIQTPGGGPDSLEARSSTYNGMLTPKTVLGSWKRFKNKELSNEVLIAYGYGDGGGGPTLDMLKMRRAMDALPALPKVQNTRAGDFFRRLHQRVAAAGRPVPVWDGELYLEYHRGTYTSQGHNKRWNRLLEFELAEAEALCVMGALAGGGYPRQKLDNGWEIVLRNQFHDIIPGSSIREVYEDSDKEYLEACADTADARNTAFHALTTPQEDAFTLFSSASFPREDLTFLPAQGEGVWMDGDTVLPAQRCAGGYWVQAPLAPFALKTVRFVADQTAAAVQTPFEIDAARGIAQTPLYTLHWDSQGRLTRIYDKRSRREVLAEGGQGNRLEVYEDKPLDYENWDIDIFHTQKCEPVVLDAPAEVVEIGALRAVIRFHFSYRQSSFVQDMILYASSPRIDFDTTADWNETRRLLKVAFDTSVRTTKATYDIQYGHAERPTHSNTSWDMARFEVVAHKWADLSESNYGVSLLNNCKYGHSAKDGTLRLSLLKSGKFPDTQADMGAHAFTYALLPHAGQATDGGTIEQATMLNLPVRTAQGAARPVSAVIATGTDALVIDAVKLAEDGKDIIVRMHECRGGSHDVQLTTGLAPSRIELCNILEQPLGQSYAADCWQVRFTPFEIKTFRIVL